MALAALLYVRRVCQTTTVEPVTQDSIDERQPHILQGNIPPFVSILRIHGPFLFGTTRSSTRPPPTCRPSSPSWCCGRAT